MDSAISEMADISATHHSSVPILIQWLHCIGRLRLFHTGNTAALKPPRGAAAAAGKHLSFTLQASLLLDPGSPQADTISIQVLIVLSVARLRTCVQPANLIDS